jgi:uncharacterized Zn finger protein (UPF0148 family)
VRMRQQAGQDDHANTEGDCERCGATVLRFRGQGDLTCSGCGANYNCAGQRLRDDLRVNANESERDDDVGDLEGYERAMLRAEAGRDG